MITERYIFSLLTGDHDWDDIIRRLEWLGRAKAPGLEGHHIEPERVMVVYLKPLEHLAIHIAHARREPTDSYYAKVAAFVKPYPSHRYHRILPVSDELRKAVLSFGQRRPDTSHESLAHARSFIDMDQLRIDAAERGRKLKGRKCTWGADISTTLKGTPIVECEYCGKLIKNIGGNMKQHQRSSKCLKNHPRCSTTALPAT